MAHPGVHPFVAPADGPQPDRSTTGFRVRVLGVVVAAAALVLAGCGGDGGGGTAAADEDVVNWYTSMPADGARAVADAYTSKTGTSVNVQRIGSTELWQRFLTESNADKHVADVLSVASWSIIQDAKSQQLIKPFIPDQVDVGDAYSDTPGAVDPDGYTFSTRLLIEAIAYNTKLVPKEHIPATWADLEDPYWKGKLAMLDPKLDTGGYAAYHQMVASDDIGWSFFEGLSDQGPIFMSGDSGAILNRVISGESQVAILQDVLAWTQKAAGAPVAVVYPPAGVGGTLDYNALPSKAPHEENAVKFLEYLAGPDAADALVKSIFVYSPRNGAVVSPEDRPALSDLNRLPSDPEAEDADFDSFNTRFNEAVGR